MHPVLLELGPLKIHWFGVTLALGFAAGLANWVWLGRRNGRDANYCSDILLWIVVSGILGARLAYVISDWRSFAAEPLSIVRIDQGGLIFYGGLAGATAAAMLFARRRGESPLAFADFAATSLPLGHAFGRIGCFLNGCCHGAVSGAAPGVRYPADSLAWTAQVGRSLVTRFDHYSLPVHPVQLYESGLNVLLYVALVLAYRRRPRPGVVVGLYFLGYAAIRFGTECLRGDDRLRWGPVNAAQAISLLLAALGYALLAGSRRAESRPA